MDASSYLATLGSLLTGSSLIALFVILRSGNFYGDANRWSVQPTSAFTMLSFLNTTK